MNHNKTLHMKKIGYIYRYNENERKGILAYEYTKDSSNIQKKPIKFSKENCITPVRTGKPEADARV